MIADYHDIWNKYNVTDNERELLNTLIDTYSINSTFTVRETNEKGHEFTDRLFSNLNSKALLNKDAKEFTFNKNKILNDFIEYGEYYNKQEQQLTEAGSKRFSTKKVIIISVLIAFLGMFILNIFSFIIAIAFFLYYYNGTSKIGENLKTVEMYQNNLARFLEIENK